MPDLGSFIAAAATAVTPSSVTLSTGGNVPFDFLILAPGSSYPEPAIKGFSGTLADRKAAIQVCHVPLSTCECASCWYTCAIRNQALCSSSRIVGHAAGGAPLQFA